MERLGRGDRKRQSLTKRENIMAATRQRERRKSKDEVGEECGRTKKGRSDSQRRDGEKKLRRLKTKRQEERATGLQPEVQ